MIRRQFVQMLRCRKALAYGLLWIVWGALAYAASVKAVLPGDFVTTQWVQSFRSAKLDALMRGVSILGDWNGIIGGLGVVAVAFCLAGKGKDSLLILLTPVILGIGDALQWLIHRPRPSADMVIQLTELDTRSFPSGHVVWATALVVCLLFLIDLRQRPYLRVAFWTLLVSFPLLMGLSRIYLGAHWLSDVIGGYFFATLSATGLCTIYRRWLEPKFIRMNPTCR